jgi:hypothetical protein
VSNMDWRRQRQLDAVNAARDRSLGIGPGAYHERHVSAWHRLGPEVVRLTRVLDDLNRSMLSEMRRRRPR